MLGRTPVNRGLRHFGWLAAGFMAAVAVACSGMGEPAGPVESAPTASPTQVATTQTGTAALTPTATSKPSAVQAPSSGMDYDSTENMFWLFSGPGHDPDNTRQAISLAVANNDKSMVPVMIEMLRFLWGPGLPIETDAAISAITGRESESASRAWHEWMEWLAKNADQYASP